MTYGAVGYLLCAMLKYFHYVKLKLKSHLILNHLVQFSYFVVVSLFAAFPGTINFLKKRGEESNERLHKITKTHPNQQQKSHLNQQIRNKF